MSSNKAGMRTWKLKKRKSMSSKSRNENMETQIETKDILK
jgi:hypothetical protein